MISTAIFIYLLYKWVLLGDMMINAYYFLMSIYGWFIWTRKEKAQEVLDALTCQKAEITQEIPAAALLKATEKKQNQKNV